MPPGEPREDFPCPVAFAQDGQRTGEGLDGRQPEGRPEVDRVGGHEEGQRPVDPLQVEGLALGGLPGAVERDQPVGAGRAVGGRQRPVGAGVEDDSRRRGPRRPVEGRPTQACELPGGALLGVVVALVADV